MCMLHTGQLIQGIDASVGRNCLLSTKSRLQFESSWKQAILQVDRSHPQLSPRKGGCVFSVACGSHTHFFAAPSPAEARAWVEAVTAAWVQVGPPPLCACSPFVQTKP